MDRQPRAGPAWVYSVRIWNPKEQHTKSSISKWRWLG